MITTLIPETKCQIFINLTGLQIAKDREVCKNWKEVIDSNESLIYKIRLTIEFPVQFAQYYKVCTFRNDWKNIYIISDQYKVAQSRTSQHREVIRSRAKFEIFDKIALIFEIVADICCIGSNIVKITSFGFLATRPALINFLSKNPGLTINEATTALKTLPSMTTTLN